jgi:hypothetical protein
MRRHNGVIHSCQRATPGSGERPCSTKVGFVHMMDYVRIGADADPTAKCPYAPRGLRT